MPERKMVIDYETEITQHLLALKVSGKMNPDANAIHQLCLIYQEVTKQNICLSCPSELSKVYKYFLSKAKKF